METRLARVIRATPLHGIVPALLVATVCSAPAAAQRIAYDSTAGSWTLTSGRVSYRLLRRAREVGFDYFGPTSRMAARPDSAQPSRYELTGLAADQSLEPSSLRLLSDSVVTVSPGVEELRLSFVHASLPLQLDVSYAAWGQTGVFSREIRLTNRGSSPSDRAAPQHQLGASRRRLHAALSLGKLGTGAAAGGGNSGCRDPAI